MVSRPALRSAIRAFVRQLFKLAELPATVQPLAADAVDRKDPATLQALLDPLDVSSRPEKGAPQVFPIFTATCVCWTEARRLAPWPETAAACDHLEAVLTEFEDSSELLLDLGMARRLSYYTGVTFRAYTFDFRTTAPRRGPLRRGAVAALRRGLRLGSSVSYRLCPV